MNVARILKKSIYYIVSITLIFLPSFCAASSNNSEHYLVRLQQELNKIEPTLKDSIITISSRYGIFSYSGRNITDQSQFYIGSLTKHMTAYMLLSSLRRKYAHLDLTQLLEQKIILLFPNSTFLKNVNRTWISEITLLDLLTHRSGLSDYIDYYQSELMQPQALNNPINPVEIMQSVHFNPEKTYHYSNTNYFLLAKLLEELEQSSFEDIFNKLIKEPGDMTFSAAPVKDNYFVLKEDFRFPKLVKNLNREIFIDMSNAVGTGNIISSSADLIRWTNYFYTKAEHELRSIMLKNYFEDEDGNWEHLGLSTELTSLGPLIAFQGGQDSYHSFLGYLPHHRITIVILSNNEDDFDKLMKILDDFFIY
ncbi:serine-type D-Ala-D-Ala carboxypeptidase [Legionella steigerwaltii]|uniref:Serine-type D-Ala-D-Ala carboxypeptidase n=1 Tax=Legionella steigerwaltii TaxID=460 RepID=A0A378LGG1_9GAMM|nr:serine hydrolase domain-containing protein [Legionella steigerwaltii]KTD81150.1 serine-type D-Ala-D-Ala carboxypeptidase [Legionella steigerwaltii]STY23161.1 serine-type D-Ala-D-Ala carboxypeptidase [Legionella steigerwaltii]